MTLWEGVLDVTPTDFGPPDTVVIDGIPVAWLCGWYKTDVWRSLMERRGMRVKVLLQTENS